MAKVIPIPTKANENMPPSTEVKEAVPVETQPSETKPKETTLVKEIPVFARPKEEEPVETPPKEEMPSPFIEENCVTIAGHKIEIKPTKLSYFRNKTATTYGLLKKYPLTELFNITQPGILDEKRDGDQIIYDFLVASLDDKDFVRDHYNEMEADQVEQIVRIVGRLNHTDEKEEAERKNREAQAKH